MYDTTSGWLMTTFDLNPFDVSLLHTATTLPIFMFTLPAGAVADIRGSASDDHRGLLRDRGNDRRSSAAVRGARFRLAYRVWPLTTFRLSAAWSLNTPAWLSIVPQLVPKVVIPEAIAAHSVGYNLSRTTPVPRWGASSSPSTGAATPLWIFVGGNLGVIAALTWWRAPSKQRASLPAERLSSALRTGLRHTANNRLLWATLARTIAIYLFTAAYWGLLPLIARRTGQGAEHYGVLLSAISIGAIIGSLGHENYAVGSAPTSARCGTILTAFALVLFSVAQDLTISLVACLLAGMAWVNNLTCLYTSAQTVLPDWVRRRGLAVFLTVIYGTMTLSSAAWGEIAAAAGLAVALLIAAGGAILWIPLTLRWKLQQGAALDLSPSQHWSLPETREEIDNDRGPVLVKIEYRIDPKDSVAFVRALDELGSKEPRQRVRVGNLRGRRRSRAL